jgi:hypothetical protein
VIAKMQTDLTYTVQGTTTPRKTVADIGLMEKRRATMQEELAADIEGVKADVAALADLLRPAAPGA